MITILSLALLACSPRSADDIRADMDSTQSDIDDLVGDGSCATDSCSALAYGDKMCGGPSTYTVYCADSVDETELGSLADRYTELESEWNAQMARENPGVAGTCDVVEAPPVGLVDGACVELE